jgi:hypothetical protein
VTARGIVVAKRAVEISMADKELDDLTVVPMPTGETEAEHRRIRSSNDRDQKLEREGKIAPHNRGYDQAADGTPTPTIERIVDE